ncbi:MAG: GTP 3',8-cyclase MoaA [Acidimicrobiales bacterium]
MGAGTDLIDRFGRVHTDLRISITDRCNFRCQYCMPSEGMEWMDRADLLTFEEIERLAGLLVTRAGVRSIRLTGGEPTVRANVATLVGKLSALGVDLAMTTNGATLAALADDLKAAGLNRLNISLDTLDPDRFERLTRRRRLDQVLEGIDAAVAAGFDPVKLNAVLMRGINDDEIVDFLALGHERGVSVRFIEFMPLDAQGDWSPNTVVSHAEILEAARTYRPFTAVPRGSAPAERFRYDDGSGEFGIIATVSAPFCASCDRIRLPADGQFRNCLFGLEHLDVRSRLRDAATDEEILAAIAGLVDRKWAGHQVGKVHFVRPSKSMSQLGG